VSDEAVVNPDIAFVQEVLDKLKAGEIGNILVAGTVMADGRSFVAGSGAEYQMNVLKMMLKSEVEAEQRGRAARPIIKQAIGRAFRG
jgi:hypothetical protein